jgi:hypothetical protein
VRSAPVSLGGLFVDKFPNRVANLLSHLVACVVHKPERGKEKEMTTLHTGNKKGRLATAQAVYSPTTEYGVRTEWAVQLVFQSPTGDSSDFIYREIPCLSEPQAYEIADYWNRLVSSGVDNSDESVSQ